MAGTTPRDVRGGEMTGWLGDLKTLGGDMEAVGDTAMGVPPGATGIVALAGRATMYGV